MSKKPSTYFVFVYGTLQSEYGNNHVMTESGKAKLIGKATTLQKFYMASGGFPRLSKKVDGEFTSGENRNDYFGQVAGELWEIDHDSLEACDRLEGHPTFYKREELPVVHDKGRKRHKAWIYVITDPFDPVYCMPKNGNGLLKWQPLPAWGSRHNG